ncbi:MAG: electron transport complex subunit RsxA [Candidatus Omnitrophica bacterium]|nr:electron transport complex subunit RsxA [Candidatus Omnitrophota bacterium]
MVKELFLIFIAAVLVNNFVLARFLGICPFLGVSGKIRTAVGMGMAVLFVMVIASAVTYCLYHYVLVPFDIVYLRTISFILVIASLVQVVEIVLQKISAKLYQALGIFLPLITTNCAILGLTILTIDNKYNFFTSIVFSMGAAMGFALALVIMAGIRERLLSSDIPAALRGIPIALIVAGLLSIAFLGFSGLVKF